MLARTLLNSCHCLGSRSVWRSNPALIAQSSWRVTKFLATSLVYPKRALNTNTPKTEEFASVKEKPSDGRTSPDLAELNNKGMHAEVIEIVENGACAIQDSTIREYLRAVSCSSKFEVVKLRDVMGKWLGESGKTPNSPLYVTTLSSKSQYLYYLFSFGIGLLLVFAILSPTGLSGRLFSPLHKEHSTLTRKEKLSDVIGNEEAIEDIQDLLQYLKNPAKFANMGIAMPRGVLLVGPPGTGKTLLARALAAEAGVPFYYTSGSEFEEMLVGVGASRVRNLFNTARTHAPCIVFIDEIDAIGSRRETPGNKTAMTLNQLLVELDGFSQSTGVLVVAATNLPELLDPALIRPGRFDRHVYLDLPTKKAREAMFEFYLKDKKGPDVDVELLSKTCAGLSGADIFSIVNRATIEVIKNGKEVVNQQCLEDALESSMMGRHRKSLVISDTTKRLTAFHEAGHALVSLHTPGAQVIHKATLVPRGPALGMVRHLSKDDLMQTKQEMLAMMDVAMGGRAAEELIFGSEHVTQGAGSDFQQATSVAHSMVTKLGMSDKVGKVYLKAKKEQKISEDTSRLIDAEVRNLTEKSFARAKELLRKHSSELHLLANALLEHETLSLEEISEVVRGKQLTHKQHDLSTDKTTGLAQIL